MDKKSAGSFKNVIDSIIEAYLDKKGVTKYISAVVKQVNDDNTVDVFIIPDENRIIHKLLNKTGEILKPGNSVELCTKNGKLSNAWVAVKHSSNNGGLVLLWTGNVTEGSTISLSDDVDNYTEIFTTTGSSTTSYTGALIGAVVPDNNYIYCGKVWTNTTAMQIHSSCFLRSTTNPKQLTLTASRYQDATGTTVAQTYIKRIYGRK